MTGGRVHAPIPWAELGDEARRRFGITQWRPGQREIIEDVMSGRDCLGILPTGAGKSLCYQLPALFLEGLVVVVSPLIALMHDQADPLNAAAIGAARLDSTVPLKEQRRLEEALAGGVHNLVLLSPERLMNPAHVEPLKRRGVSLFVVDEAHCVSQWGHDFRPSYLHLRQVIVKLGRPPVLALTATAPPERMRDILQSLGIEGAHVIHGGIERDNLQLEVRHTVSHHEKERALLCLLDSTPGSVIVYVATVRRAEALHEWLCERHIVAERYHGRLPRRVREAAQERFMSGRSRVIVATSAFGLGVDKPDVRCVVHWNFPDSLESYYQEAGRAGRDGLSARCVLLYRLEDRRIWSFLLAGQYPHVTDVARLLERIEEAPPAPGGWTLRELAAASRLTEHRVLGIVMALEACGTLARSGERLHVERRLEREERAQLVADFASLYLTDRGRLRAMTRYAQSTACRMRFLREYFGEPAAGPCGRCDNCRRPPRLVRPRITGLRRPVVTAEPRFAHGTRVHHLRFGSGEVRHVEGDQLVVDFVRGGERRVLASYLEPAP